MSSNPSSATSSLYYLESLKKFSRDFLGGPVVENPPFKAGGMGSLPVWGTEIAHAVGQRSPRATARQAYKLRLESPCPATRTQCTSQKPFSHLIPTLSLFARRLVFV